MDRTIIPLEMTQTPFGPMIYPSNDLWVGKSLRELGWYGIHQAMAIRAVGDPSLLAVDVGANCGALTIPMLQSFAGVVAFEPQPDMRGLVYLNACLARKESSLALYQILVGAGKGNGFISLPDYGEEGNFGGVEQLHNINLPSSSLEVPISSLDELSSGRNRKVGFIKIDVEGGEREVLAGARQLLQEDRPILMVEADRPDSSPEVIETLLSMGYHPQWFITPLFHTRDTIEAAAEGDLPIIASFDLLAWPRGMPPSIGPLRDALPSDPIGRVLTSQLVMLI